MKETIDNFSKQADGYSKFRPVYPQALFDEILSNVRHFETCWDCATGNGQIATVLAEHFDHIVASDISEQQLAMAPKMKNVEYVKCRAEETPFVNDSFDLIIVGQAVHWFDHKAFNAEIKRVAKPNAVIAIIGYGLMYVDEKVDAHLAIFYNRTIGEYWAPERKHIDTGYASIPFPFRNIEMSKAYCISDNWTFAQYEGYLKTWSSVVKYEQTNGKNPVDDFIAEMASSGAWKIDEKKEVRFPLFVKLGRLSTFK